MTKIAIPSDGILATNDAIATLCELMIEKGLISRDEIIERFSAKGRFYGRQQMADGALVMTFLVAALKMPR